MYQRDVRYTKKNDLQTIWDVLIEIWFSINNQMSHPGQVIEGTPLGSVISIPVFQKIPLYRLIT